MVLNSILFYFFAALAVGSAILMVTRRNVVHGAVYLITTLLATAGVFLLLQAEFLFIFVIMRVNLDVSRLQYQFNRQRFVAGVLALALGAQIFLAIKMGQKSLFPQASVPEILPKNTEAVADALFGHFMLPFEIASILLLVAMIGAVVMAKRRV